MNPSSCIKTAKVFPKLRKCRHCWLHRYNLICILFVVPALCFTVLATVFSSKQRTQQYITFAKSRQLNVKVLNLDRPIISSNHVNFRKKIDGLSHFKQRYNDNDDDDDDAGGDVLAWNFDWEDLNVSNSIEKPLYKEENLASRDIFESWNLSSSRYCNNKFTTYADHFALFKGLTVNMKYARGPKGGEHLQTVLNQREEDEYMKLYRGFFCLECDRIPVVRFRDQSHLNTYMAAFDTKCAGRNYEKLCRKSSGLTVAINRYEYANLYHTMTDFYNIFLLTSFLGKDPSESRVLLMDSHPEGSLDGIWSTLFGAVTRVGHLKSCVTFEELLWATLSYNNLMNKHDLPSLPLVTEFKNFYLERHKVDSHHRLNCSRVNVLVIWRHDYVAHPRNPTGVVSRKIHNEDEVLKTLLQFPDLIVKAEQIDLYSMKKQLELVSQTDILMGMHGAGLSHTLFLPPHAGLIEFYPSEGDVSNIHFRAMAKWRQLRYLKWQNSEPDNEYPNQSASIPPDIVTLLMNVMLSQICDRELVIKNPDNVDIESLY